MGFKKLIPINDSPYLEDPEEEMERMNHPHSEMVNRFDPKKAEQECQKIAKANNYKLTGVERRLDGYHDCYFE
ncbi:MAG TPA: hypothetical protein DCL61_06820 [Cyanobacteria bacterium UBA12227]|nr:hypothetical protein [Cyanobacteria bacterium UBA12227]HAX86370.1 hypothetical protein [Cyanobacteria bacterium UBA11370]HBY77024.1 hypothetical protein [Cyanobacteria bacterium UBA11148]